MRAEKLMNSGCPADKLTHLRSHAEWLLKVGNGTLPTIWENMIEVKIQMICRSPSKLEDKVYNNFFANFYNPEYLSKRAVISCLNDTI